MHDLTTLQHHLTRLGLHLHARPLAGEEPYAVLDVDPGVSQLVVDVRTAVERLGLLPQGLPHDICMWALCQAVVPGVRVFWDGKTYQREDGVMPKLSQKRKTALAEDAPIVHRLYAAACERFGAAEVARSLTLVWTIRCMWGMQGVLPFDATASRNVGELLYVARDVCHLGQEGA